MRSWGILDVSCHPFWHTTRDETINCCAWCSLIVSEPPWHPEITTSSLFAGVTDCSIQDAQASVMGSATAYHSFSTKRVLQSFLHASSNDIYYRCLQQRTAEAATFKLSVYVPRFGVSMCLLHIANSSMTFSVCLRSSTLLNSVTQSTAQRRRNSQVSQPLIMRTTLCIYVTVLQLNTHTKSIILFSPQKDVYRQRLSNKEKAS